MSFAKILCAFDLSENALETLRQAIGVADCYAADLHVLHVMPEMDARVVNYVASVMGEERFADLELDHEAEVEAQLRALVNRQLGLTLAGRTLRGGVTVEVHHGKPAEEILKAVARLDIDLVVLGSHGKGRIQYVLLGSVAEQVLQRLDRPALVGPLR